MAGKSYTFRGTGDFSDFNNKAKQAASTMGESFKKAYENMLENAEKYSSSSRKQIDYLSNSFKNLKENSISEIDNTLDTLFNKIKLDERKSLSGLDSWKSSSLEKSNIQEEYQRRTGNKFDPYSQSSNQFEKSYRNEIEKKYHSQRNKIFSRSESKGNELDKIREQLESLLEGLSPKEYYDKLRDLAQIQIIEAKEQNRNLIDIINQLEESDKVEDRLLASQLREEVQTQRRVEKRQILDEEKGKGSDTYSLLKSLSGFSYIDRLANVGQGLARSKNGSELFGELVDGVAAAGGGLSQLLMTGLGTAAGGPIGTILGGAASVILGKSVEGGIKIVGEAAKRTMDERESLSLGMNKYRSLTGSTQTFRDLSYQGVDYKTFVEEQNSLARSNAGRVSNRTVESSLSLQKGYGIDRSTLASLLEIQRGTSKELESTIGRILTKGESDNIFERGDRTFFSEFTQKFVSLQKDFLKTQDQVSDTNVLDVFSMFDKLGGQFSTKDYRSLGNIEAINSSLANPQSDAVKALSYKLISERNPNLDFFDIQMEMQKGLSSPKYFKDRLRFIKDNYKDDPALAKSEIASQFGLQNNLSAAKSIYENMESILSSEISNKEIMSKYGLGDYKKEAKESTTFMEKQQAQITNEFIKSAKDGMIMAGNALVDTVKQAFAGATFTVKNGEVTFSRVNVTSNILKTPSKKSSRELNYPTNPTTAAGLLPF